MKRSKNQRRVLVLLCAMAILFLGRPDVYAISSQNNVQQKLLDQQLAVDASEALMQYFFDNGWVTEYPDYYGGGYIKNNIFNVRLVAPTDQIMDVLDKIFEPYKEAVAYELCDISQKDAQAYADETAKVLIADGYAITHWYTDNITGNIVIGVQETDIQEVTEQVAHIQKNSKGTTGPTVVIEKGEYFN